jgi:hypothetical protein
MWGRDSLNGDHVYRARITVSRTLFFGGGPSPKFRVPWSEVRHRRKKGAIWWATGWTGVSRASPEQTRISRSAPPATCEFCPLSGQNPHLAFRVVGPPASFARPAVKIRILRSASLARPRVLPA